MEWKEKSYYSDLSKEVQVDVKTERNWALAGMVPLSADSGKELYPNRFNQGKARYYGREEVRPGTKEELDALLGPEKARKKELAKARREKKQQEEKEEWDRMREAVWEADRERREAREKYMELCQHIGAAALQDGSEPTRRIVIDTETTGLDVSWDEILQLSIIDADTGEKIFDGYFKPFFIKEWPEAQAVNNISPEMVADKPYFAEKVTEIQKIIAAAHTVIGYNVVGFDRDFLEARGDFFQICRAVYRCNA